MALMMLHHSISPSEFFSYTNLPFSCVSNWTVPVANFFAEIFCCGDEVQMVFEDDVAEQRHPIFVLQESPRIENDLHCLWPREHRQPSDDSAGEKMRLT